MVEVELFLELRCDGAPFLKGVTFKTGCTLQLAGSESFKSVDEIFV